MQAQRRIPPATPPQSPGGRRALTLGGARAGHAPCPGGFSRWRSEIAVGGLATGPRRRCPRHGSVL